MRRSGAGAKAPKRHSGARTDVADVPHFLPRPRPLPADSRREVGGAAPASPIPNPPPPPKLLPLLLPPPLNIDPPLPPNIEPPSPALPPNARGAVALAPKPPNPPDAAAGAPPAGQAGQTQLFVSCQHYVGHARPRTVVCACSYTREELLACGLFRVPPPPRWAYAAGLGGGWGRGRGYRAQARQEAKKKRKPH